jgi:hypothetical protein
MHDVMITLAAISRAHPFTLIGVATNGSSQRLAP